MPRNKQKKNTKKLAHSLKQCKISATLTKVSENQSDNEPKNTILDQNQIENGSSLIPIKDISAIFIHKPVEFKLHAHALLTLGVKFYQPRLGQNYTKIKCVTMEDHIALIKYLKRNKLPYHTYGDPAQKKMKVVIRGLPLDTCLNMLKDELKSINIPAVRVHKMHTLQTKKPHPLLVLVVVNNIDDGKKLMEITELLGHKVQMETPIVKPKQCHRCQKWGHAQRYCHGVVRCVKCAGEHASAKCVRDPKKEPPKCANCGGEHTASYRKCPCYPDSEAYKTLQNLSRALNIIKGNKKPVLVTLLNYQDLYKNVTWATKLEEVF